jgi:uncharacterized membrane protein YccF (DUF307 family)
VLGWCACRIQRPVLRLLLNFLWIAFAGWWLALGHLSEAILLAVMIIGLPFALAHLKLAGIALWPIGMMIVLAEAAPPGW